jgi:hypothetical protein
MNKILTKYIDKLFFKKWIIGIYRDNIEDIIRNKKFDPDINWLFKRSFDAFQADPFLLTSDDNNIKILYEDFNIKENYGKISLMVLDNNYVQVKNKILLDTKSHISYPYIFTENNKTYIFPEAGRSGKLSCYEYDHRNESIDFVRDILNLPLYDSTILKYNEKYWIFGSLSEIDIVRDKITDYKLHIFFSDNLMGPYVPHPVNPVKSGLNNVRSAGNFIEVDNILYRPSQNCKNEYGESMEINKVITLSETDFSEEPYLNISINKKNRNNSGMHTIHTINTRDKLIVVDGLKWTFAPIFQLKYYIRNRRRGRRMKSVGRINKKN